MTIESDKQVQKPNPDDNAQKESDSGQKAEAVKENPPRTIKNNKNTSEVKPKEQGNIYDARERLGQSLDSSRQKPRNKKIQGQEENTPTDNDKNSENFVNASIKNAVDSNINVVGGDLIAGATPEQIGTIVDTIFRRLLQINAEKSPKSSPKKPPKNLEEGLNELDLFEKTYIITFCFFEGIRVTDFDNIFETIREVLLDKLYEQKEQLRRIYMLPPTIQGMEIVEKFDSDRSSMVCKFKQDDIGQTLLALIKERHSKLLYKFAPAIKKVIEQHPDNTEIRVLAAYALGEIAKLDIRYVYDTVIKPLANDKDDGVRATVGYFFAYLFISPSQDELGLQNYLRGILTQWSNSDGWHYKWSAASVCEQLGLFGEDSQIQDFARDTLEKLASTDHVRVANAVIHALVGWSLRRQLFNSFHMINKWAEQGSAGRNDQFNPYQVRCVVGLWAFWAIIIRNSEMLNKRTDYDSIQPVDIAQIVLENQKKPSDLLPTMTTVAIRCFEYQMGNYFFDMLEKWVDTASNSDILQKLIPIWLRKIHASLPANSLHRRHMENRITNIWLKSKNSKLLAIAKDMQRNN